MRRNTSTIAVGLLLAVAVLGGAACEKDKEFAKLNSRVAGYLQVGIELVDKQTTGGQMSPATGLAIVNTLSAVNTINGQLIDESRRYLSPDGKRLVFDAEGKARVLQIVESGQRSMIALLESPDFASMPEDKRREWIELIKNVTLTLDTMGEVVRTAKEVKQ